MQFVHHYDLFNLFSLTSRKKQKRL